MSESIASAHGISACTNFPLYLSLLSYVLALLFGAALLDDPRGEVGHLGVDARVAARAAPVAPGGGAQQLLGAGVGQRAAEVAGIDGGSGKDLVE